MYIAWIRNGRFEKVGEFVTRREAWKALLVSIRGCTNCPDAFNRVLGVVVGKGDSPTMRENWLRWIEVRTGKLIREKIK